MIIANDIGASRYRKNPQNNQIIIISSGKNIVSKWTNKEKISKLIKKEIENKIK